MIIKKNYGGVNCMICIRTKFRCSPFHLVSDCKVGYIPFAKIRLAWTFLTEKGKTDYKINAFFLSWKLKLELACVFFPKTQNRQQRKFARKPRLRERETGKESTYLVTKSCTLIRLWTKKHKPFACSLQPFACSLQPFACSLQPFACSPLPFTHWSQIKRNREDKRELTNSHQIRRLYADLFVF